MKKTVTLEPGESKQLTFSFTPAQAGGYIASVNGLLGSFTVLPVPVPPVYTCAYCGATFDTEAELVAHLASAHPQLPPIYTCPECGAMFSTEAELIAHIEAEHPEVPPPPPSYLTSLYGRITDVDTGNPLPGVSATLDGIVSGVSNSSGYYELSGFVPIYGIAKQWKTISFTKDYYGTITRDVSGLSGDVRMDIKMKQVAYPCPKCGATFPTQAELDAHLATAHLDWNFTGSLGGRCTEYYPDYNVCYKADIDYSISNPNAPNFRWHVIGWDRYYTNWYERSGNGPSSGRAFSCSGGARLYAHPDPNARLQGYASEAGGFVQESDFKLVASIGVEGLKP